MKNNYNPYTVPENFFEDSCISLIEKNKKHRRNLRYAAMAVACVLVAVPLFFQFSGADVQETEVSANSLAQMYEYDIFLQVNF